MHYVFAFNIRKFDVDLEFYFIIIFLPNKGLILISKLFNINVKSWSKLLLCIV